jgi:hypothetical protein
MPAVAPKFHMTYKELFHLLSLMDDQELSQEVHLYEHKSGEVLGVVGLHKSYGPENYKSNIPTVTLSGTIL